MKKISFFLISNMYPSENMPYYGVFIKNIEEGLSSFGAIFRCRAVIKGKSKNFFTKFLNYLWLYIQIFFKSLLCSYSVIYAHYPLYFAFMIFVVRLLRPRKFIIFNFHGSDIVLEKKDLLTLLFWRIMIFISRKVDLVVVPSKYFKGLIKKWFRNKKIIIYPSGGIDVSMFKPLSRKLCKRQFGLGDKFVISWVSRIDEGKGWRIFLKALKNLADKGLEFKALVAGIGKEVLEFKDILKKYNLEKFVVYLGGCRQSELVYIYNASDVFVSTSFREAESLNLTALEAMACGTPVIATNGFGYTDYIKDGFNGFLFKKGDYRELVLKLEKFMQMDETSRMEMSKNALMTASKYDRYKVNKQFFEDLRCLLKK